MTFATLTAEAMGQTGKRNLEHEVILLVNRPDGSTDEFGLVVEVPYDRPLIVDREIPVKISPSRKGYLEIDFDSMPSLNDIGSAAVDAARNGRIPDVAGDLGYEKDDQGA